MIIIQKGQLPETRQYQQQCYYCKTVVQFGYQEGRVTSDQRDGDFISVLCPLCSRPINSAVSEGFYEDEK